MTKSITLFFSCILTFNIFFATQIHAQSAQMRALHNEEKTQAQALLQTRLDAPQANEYDMKYMRLEWTIDPNVYYIKGKITYYFVPNQSFNEFYLDCSDTLKIDSAFYHATLLSTSFTDTQTLKIDLPQTISVGVMDSVSIYYEGAPKAGGFGSFSITHHNGVANLWTLSEPYGAPGWMPCKQSLVDKNDSIDIYVTVPPGNKSGGNGLLVDTTVNAQTGWVTFHWKHRYPIATYLIGISVTNYAEFDFKLNQGTDTVFVQNYYYPEETFDTTNATAIIPIIQFYIQNFGTYPFSKEKYGHQEFGWSGGMEHQTMTSLSDFDPELMSHELMHQWFGDKVTCASWHDIWLNEGFAECGTALWLEHNSPTVYGPRWRQLNLSYIISNAGGSVYVDDTTSVDRIFDGRLTYSKGAYVLLMLKYILGDSIYFKGVQDYLNDPKLAYGFAHTSDLERHIDTACNCNMSTFFQQWYYGQGFPIYRLNWSQDDSGAFHVYLQESTSVPSSVSFFALPVPIRLYGEGGDSLDLLLNNTYTPQQFDNMIPFRVTSVAFDPDLHLIEGHFGVTGIPNIKKEENLVVFPNPASNFITIENNSSFTGSIDVSVFDVTGKLVQLLQVNGNGNNTLSIPVNSIPQGMYLLHLKNDQHSWVGKFEKY